MILRAIAILSGAALARLAAQIGMPDQLEVVIGGLYPLSEARRAHDDIAARRTQGKLLLDPAA